MSTEEKINVVMLSPAAQGHLNPMLRFANRLISKGVHVTFITTELARHRLLKNNNAFTNKNPQLSQNPEKIQFEFFSDGLSPNFDREKDAKTFLDTLQTQGAKNLSSLITNLVITKGQNYSCMITDIVLAYFTIDIATEHGIPVALLWTLPTAVFSICHSYYNNIDSFPNLDDPNEKVEFPGLPVVEVRDLPSFIRPSSPQYHTSKKIHVHLNQSLHKLKWVLGTSFYEMEEEAVKSMASLTLPIYSIGPLVSQFLLGEKEANAVSMDMWNTHEDSCIGWLDNQRPSSVIYLSFGSIILLSQKQVNSIATALKNSNKAFLWVIRPSEGGSEEDVTKFPPGFLEETKGRGLVVTWCPQEKVLMHPAVACFFTHCGWNSVLEAVVAGVPVIAYPKFLDHPTIAKFIVNKFQNGVRLNFEEDCTEELERGIREVMEGPNAGEIKKRALELKEAARKALGEGGSSDKYINQFLSDLKSVGNLARA